MAEIDDHLPTVFKNENDARPLFCSGGAISNVSVIRSCLGPTKISYCRRSLAGKDSTLFCLSAPVYIPGPSSVHAGVLTVVRQRVKTKHRFTWPNELSPQ
jgi:hypothetical protein